jgi:hypothetical protein
MMARFLTAQPFVVEPNTIYTPWSQELMLVKLGAWSSPATLSWTVGPALESRGHQPHPQI